MTAKLIDGKAFAAGLRGRVKTGADALLSNHGTKPGLAVVIVGEDPASQVYVRNKVKQTAEAGMESIHHELPTTTEQSKLEALIDDLNADPKIHGILVQLPLPGHIDSDAVLARIIPEKDVDGFHEVNVGRLSIGATGNAKPIIPCTPWGSLMLIKDTLGDITGANAVIVGRSNIVGKPMAQLLLGANATVTVAHSRTKDLPALCKTADILVAAVGRPEMIKGDWVRDGACVIDVGINRIPKDDGKTKLVGDVAFDECLGHAGSITPVPGGVGPMTIACLLANTLTAAHRSLGLDDPEV